MNHKIRHPRKIADFVGMPMTNCPDVVDENQLDELSIAVTKMEE